MEACFHHRINIKKGDFHYTRVDVKGELGCKMNLWSNKTLVPSQPFSEICFHDNRM